MKLAEARFEIDEITGRLADLTDRLKLSSLKNISVLLDEFNTLLLRKQKLQLAVEKAESDTVVAGGSIRDFSLMIDIIEEKLETLRYLAQRSDLNEELSDLIFSQLASFTHTKTQLQSSIQKISWEVEVLL